MADAPNATPTPAAPAAAAPAPAPAGASPAGGPATPSAAAGVPAGPQPGATPGPAAPKGPEKFGGKTPAEWQSEHNRLATQLRKANDQLSKVIGKDGNPVLLSEFKADPVAFATKHGVALDQLADAILKASTGTPQTPAKPAADPKLAQEVEDLRNWKQEQTQAQQQREYQAAVTQLRGDIADYLKTDEGKGHEYCLGNGDAALELVHEVMRQHFQLTADDTGENGEVLAIKDAVAKVEKYYEDQAERYFSTGKAKAKYGAPAAPNGGGPSQGQGAPGSQPAGGHPPKSGGTQSLNNALESGAATPANGSPRVSRGINAVDDAIAAAIRRTG